MDHNSNGDYKSEIDALRQWLTTQHHLPKISENDVRMFLHCNYYDTEAAKKTIENYYTFRTSCKDFFANRDLDDPALRTAMDLMMFTVLPKPTPEGYKVAFWRLINTDATNFVHLNLVKLLCMCLDLWMKEDVLAPGHVIIVDMAGMNLGHLCKLRIAANRNYCYYTQEALPMRLKHFHFLNAVSFLDKIMFVSRPFLQKKVLDLIVTHTNVDTLTAYVPLECLPDEYGGKAGRFEDLGRQYYQKLAERQSELIEDIQRGLVDESKRPSNPKRFIFGLFGM